MKLFEMIKLFEAHCIYEKNLSSKTVKAYNIDLKQFREYKDSENSSLDLFDKIYIKEYVKYLFEQELKAKSIKRKVGTLKTFFNFLEFEEFIEFSPFKKMQLSIKLPKRLPKTIDKKDLRRFFKFIYAYKENIEDKNSYTYYAAVRDIAVTELLFATGMRVSELCHLKPTDINIQRGIVNIFGKGSKERAIQICDPEVKQSLVEYYKLFNKKIYEKNFFFINRLNNMLSEDSVRHMIKRYQLLSGIRKHVTPHQFRHTLATGLLEENVDIRYIQNILGHSSILTTQIYTVVNSQHQKKILKTRHPRKHLNIH
ncbi:integrase [Malaciobacter mytili LMG 24559]|uniref:Integrase n=1 Tax=Malaciobacter mytili LMG 24559 TaxID=1032238 RepID=A0AAX2AE93_9BACT|nr:tyrosine-type recombinase/integrase [Malaciobacter mytili]AXH16213.1 site-specific tyrosine recombinase, phage integrase family [Malaciobacter mytili LMG 24559]RXK13718.1 integrase [Malaciobacter mytili LMG 24559]